MCDTSNNASVFDVRYVRARKQHRCEECRAPIPVGILHARIGMLIEGSWSTNRMHYECLVLWGSAAGELCGHPGYVFVGGLWEELGEYDGDPAAEPYRQRFKQIRAIYEART